MFIFLRTTLNTSLTCCHLSKRFIAIKPKSGFFADGSKMITNANHSIKIETNDSKLNLKQIESSNQTLLTNQEQLQFDNERVLHDRQALEHQFNHDLLVKEGFLPVQADAIQSLIKESIESGIQNIKHQMISKQDQEAQQLNILAQFSLLKQSIHSLSTKNIAVLKQDLEKFKGDLMNLKGEMRERGARVHGNTILDMNLDKGRTKDEVLILNGKLNDIRKTVDEEIVDLVKRVDKIHTDLRTTISQLIGGTFVFFTVYKIFLYNSQ